MPEDNNPDLKVVVYRLGKIEDGMTLLNTKVEGNLVTRKEFNELKIETIKQNDIIQKHVDKLEMYMDTSIKEYDTKMAAALSKQADALTQFKDVVVKGVIAVLLFVTAPVFSALIYLVVQK